MQRPQLQGHQICFTQTRYKLKPLSIKDIEAPRFLFKEEKRQTKTKVPNTIELSPPTTVIIIHPHESGFFFFTSCSCLSHPVSASMHRQQHEQRGDSQSCPPHKGFWDASTRDESA